MPDHSSLPHRLLAPVLDLIAPEWCACCGAAGRAVCMSCHEVLMQTEVVYDIGAIVAGDIPVLRCADGNRTRCALTEFKDRGRRGVLGDLSTALGRVLQAAVSRIETGPVLLVPIPTSRAAWRRRGFWPLGELLVRAELPRGWRVGFGALQATRSVGDQRVRSRTARHDNLRNAFRADIARVSGKRIVLVDDVVTTGATLDEARRAVHDAGGVVVAMCALAAVPLRGDARLP